MTDKIIFTFCLLLLASSTSFASPVDSPSSYYDLVSEKDEAIDIRQPPVAESKQQAAKSQNSDADKDSDLAMHISMNNPEFRLIGPKQTPVRMPDDLQTKLVVAMENFKKEAGEVWGQVSEQVGKGWTDVRGNLEKGMSGASKSIDKGWADFKAMIEKAYNSNIKEQ